jgi:hypothetical protein
VFSVAIIPIQLIIFIVWGQPEHAIGWFDLFQGNEFAGLLAFEILFAVNGVVGILQENCTSASAVIAHEIVWQREPLAVTKIAAVSGQS